MDTREGMDKRKVWGWSDEWSRNKGVEWDLIEINKKAWGSYKIEDLKWKIHVCLITDGL